MMIINTSYGECVLFLLDILSKKIDFKIIGYSIYNKYIFI